MDDVARETDEETRVLDAADSGDLGPIGEWMESVAPRLRRIAAARIDRHVRARIDEGDVVQEAFVRVSQALPDYLARRRANDPKRLPLFLWLRLETREQVLRQHRKHLGADARDARAERRVQAFEPGVTSVHLAGLLVSPHTTPTGSVRRNEREEAVAAALERLDDMDREVIVLRHFENLSNREVSHILGMTESGASIKHLRALKRLRTIAEMAEFDLGESFA